MSNKIRVAVVGASGYTGEELVKILLDHPCVELVAVTSRQYAGKHVGEVFPALRKKPKALNLQFIDPDPARLAEIVEAAFLALPHGASAEYAKELLNRNVRIFDLSADFRLKSAALYKSYYGVDHPAPELLSEAVYGLPELYRDAIRKARLIACPGCYPTSILLPLIPLLASGVIRPEPIIINSLSGVSGAGRKVELQYLFVECHESLRPYGVPTHRHVSEIEQELSHAARCEVRVRFTPHLVPVNRGILTTMTTVPENQNDRLEQQVEDVLRKAYADAAFVDLLEPPLLPDTKHVVGTNRIQIAWRHDPRTGFLLLFSAIDNLVKGAAGQAVQALNIAYGLEETLGLPS